MSFQLGFIYQKRKLKHVSLTKELYLPSQIYTYFEREYENIIVNLLKNKLFVLT